MRSRTRAAGTTSAICSERWHFSAAAEPEPSDDRREHRREHRRAGTHGGDRVLRGSGRRRRDRRVTDTELDDLVMRFVERSLPKAEWTHAAHLAVGLWHVRRYG